MRPPDVRWTIEVIDGRIAVVQVGSQPGGPYRPNMPKPGQRLARCCWAWPSIEAAQADADALNARQAALVAAWESGAERRAAEYARAADAVLQSYGVLERLDHPARPYLGGGASA
jgi:hypothetical protein